MSETFDPHAGDYWYNVETHEVEVGAQSDWQKLLGPYQSAEEAKRAPEQVARNNEAWDKADEDE